MNRTLPPGNCGNRSAAAGWTSGCAGAVPGTLGLVAGTQAAARSPDKEKPPRRNPGGQCESGWWRSALDGVVSFPVLALSRHHSPTHLLSDRSREEPAHAVRQPTGSFHEISHGGAAWLFQQFEHLFCLGFCSDTIGLCRRGLIRRLRALFGGGGLLTRLAPGRRNTGLLCASLWLPGRFLLLGSSGCGLGRFLRFRGRCRHWNSPSGRLPRHDIHHSVIADKQGNSTVFIEGDRMAMMRRSGQSVAGGLR